MHCSELLAALRDSMTGWHALGDLGGLKVSVTQGRAEGLTGARP